MPGSQSKRLPMLRHVLAGIAALAVATPALAAKKDNTIR